MSDVPVLQIILTSDLHLVPRASFDSYLEYLTNLPSVAIPSVVLEREDRVISTALPTELATIVGNLPSVVVLSGDIGTWPGDLAASIDSYHFPRISSFPHPLLPILGNHDWGPVRRRTSYRDSEFERTYQITSLRHYSERIDSLAVIFFLIDTNIRMFPAVGEVRDPTLLWLRSQFSAGKAGRWEGFSEDEYRQAIKILVLHHTPLDRSVYKGKLSWLYYWLMALGGRDQLLDECRADIDIFLFGHTHIPLSRPIDGFLMVNSGSTTVSYREVGKNNLQCLRIYDDLSVEVQPFYWNGVRFYPSPSTPARFQRGAASGPVRGDGRWGSR